MYLWEAEHLLNKMKCIDKVDCEIAKIPKCLSALRNILNNYFKTYQVAY